LSGSATALARCFVARARLRWYDPVVGFMKSRGRHLLASAFLAAFAAGCGASLVGVSDKKECEVALAVPNMVCAEGCPIRVRSALARVTGVRDVGVDFNSRNALVDAAYPACSESGVKQMIAELRAKGYDASFVQMRDVQRLQ